VIALLWIVAYRSLGLSSYVRTPERWRFNHWRTAAWPLSSKTASIASKSYQQLRLAWHPCTTTSVDQRIST